MNHFSETTELRIIKMSDIQPVPIHWLWEPFIPYGAVSLIQGDGAAGKTSSSLAIAAAVTRGEQLPGHGGIAEPAHVIVQNAEDSYSQVVRPKLQRYGADCGMIHVIDEDEYPLSLGDERIEQTIIETGARLLIIDPVQAYLGGANMNSANGVRPLMRYLGEVASRHDCAVLLVGHLHKAGGKAAYRGLGSIDIYAAARSVMTVGNMASDNNMRYIVNNKNNFAPSGASTSFAFDDGGGFNWEGECDVSISELLKGKKDEDEKPPSQLGIAMDFISSAMSAGITSAAEIKELARSAGISKNTLDRAKAALGVSSVKKGECWQWRMPAICEGPQDTQGDDYMNSGVLEDGGERLDTVDTLPPAGSDIAEEPQRPAHGADGVLGVLEPEEAVKTLVSAGIVGVMEEPQTEADGDVDALPDDGIGGAAEEPQNAAYGADGTLGVLDSGISVTRATTAAPSNPTGKKRRRKRKRNRNYYNNNMPGNNNHTAPAGKAG